jgi:hypothetical protein
MRSKSKIYFAAVLFALVSRSFFLGYAAAEPANTSDILLQNGIFLPVSVPDRSRLNLVSVTVVIVDGAALGVVAVYDDPATARPADYCELYDNSHELVGLGWFDRFGIERMALDRGLLVNADRLEGTFVVLFDGDSV